MARQIAYDPAELRRKLLATFWENGYAETSLSDLETATGLNRRQLYNGVGDKKAMFLQALEDFDELAGNMFLAPLESSEAGLADIRNLLRKFVLLAKEAGGPTGCMVCSTSQEDIAVDASVKKRVNGYFARIEAAYRNALERAAERKEVNFSPDEIVGRSSLLFGVHVGMCILARTEVPHETLQQMAEQAIENLA